jgi:hypothetical protein
MATYAIKWDEKILVTQNNKSYLEWYKFIQEELNEIDLIKNTFKKSLCKFTDSYSKFEIDSWSEKHTEAQRVVGGGTSEFLEDLCIEWETVEELADKILWNALLFKKAYAKAERIYRQALKQL